MKAQEKLFEVRKTQNNNKGKITEKSYKVNTWNFL
jgi:hypothetical protein